MIQSQSLADEEKGFGKAGFTKTDESASTKEIAINVTPSVKESSTNKGPIEAGADILCLTYE